MANPSCQLQGKDSLAWSWLTFLYVVYQMADLTGLTLERREKLKESRPTLSDKTRTADSAKPYV